MFSKACEYGIRAVLYVAQQSEQGRRVNIREIATAIQSPEAYTAKILQKLKRINVIDSMKGPTGGFSLSEDQMNMPIANVVQAIDGDDKLQSCILGLSYDNENEQRPLHHQFHTIRQNINEALSSTTIKALAAELKPV